MQYGFRLLPLAFLPLFITLPNCSFSFLYLIHGGEAGGSIALSLNVLICMAGIGILLTMPVHARIMRYITFAISWLTLSLAVGLFLSPSLENVLFYIQTVLPFLAIPFGYCLIRREADLAKFSWCCSWTSAVAVLTILCIVLVRYGPGQLLGDRVAVIRDLEIGMPQFMSYYPLAVLATFNFSLALYLFGDQRYAKVVLFLLASHAAFLPLCWSRAGLLAFVVSAAIQLALVMTSHRGGRKDRAAWAIILFALLVPFLLDTFGSTIASRADVQSFDNESDRTRLRLLLEGLARAAERPIFGDMFIPAWDERVGGESVEISRLFGAHNQYVDMLLRGGFLYVAVFGAFYAGTIFKSHALMRASLRSASSHFQVIGCGSFSYLCSVGLAANSQLYFIQLQTAVPVFTVMGVVYGATKLAARYAPSTSTKRRPMRVAPLPRMIRQGATSQATAKHIGAIAPTSV